MARERNVAERVARWGWFSGVWWRVKCSETVCERRERR
jgi:hypothetical protein